MRERRSALVQSLLSLEGSVAFHSAPVLPNPIAFLETTLIFKATQEADHEHSRRCSRPEAVTAVVAGQCGL